MTTALWMRTSLRHKPEISIRGGRLIPPLSLYGMTGQKGGMRMNDKKDKRDYIKMTAGALLIIGLLMLLYTLTPIPVLSLHQTAAF